MSEPPTPPAYEGGTSMFGGSAVWSSPGSNYAGTNGSGGAENSAAVGAGLEDPLGSLSLGSAGWVRRPGAALPPGPSLAGPGGQNTPPTALGGVSLGLPLAGAPPPSAALPFAPQPGSCPDLAGLGLPTATAPMHVPLANGASPSPPMGGGMGHIPLANGASPSPPMHIPLASAGVLPPGAGAMGGAGGAPPPQLPQLPGVGGSPLLPQPGGPGGADVLAPGAAAGGDAYSALLQQPEVQAQVDALVRAQLQTQVQAQVQAQLAAQQHQQQQIQAQVQVLAAQHLMRLGCGNSPQCNGCGGCGYGGAGGAYPPTTNPYAPTGGFNGGAGGFNGAPVSTPFGCSNFATPGASGSFPPQPGMHQGMHMAGGGFGGQMPGMPNLGQMPPSFSNAPLPGMRSTGTTSGSRSPGSGASTPSGAGGGGGGGRRGRGGGGGNSGTSGSQGSDEEGGGQTFRQRRRRSERSDEDKSQYVIDLAKLKAGQDGRTTLMIKNIPNKYNQKLLLATIERHHACKFDLFYLPIDFKNRCAPRLPPPFLASPPLSPSPTPLTRRTAPLLCAAATSATPSSIS